MFELCISLFTDCGVPKKTKRCHRFLLTTLG